jgi:Ca2+-transporting ATPase
MAGGATQHVPSGLTDVEARERLRRFGPNRLPEPPRKHALALLIEVLREPMFLLLVLAAGLYLLIGDPAEGALLGLFAALSVGLVVVQEYRSERALDALRALAAPMARVRRDGVVRTIPASGIVPGDRVLVAEGERVPADAVLREGGGLRVDESLLTGESVPVTKGVAAPGLQDPGQPGGEGGVGLFAGTLVVSGHGVAEVVATGAATQAGRIGASLAGIVVEKTLLQRSMGRLVRLLGAAAAIVSVGVFVLHGLVRDEWMEGALSGIAVAMALLPEEFPVAFAVFMAFGAWRLAQLRILARRPAVIETLGATSVLCVDKTGTLTENRMRVRVLVAPDGDAWIDAATRDVPEAVHRLLEHAVLASRVEAVDPMDRAVRHAGDATLVDTGHLHDDWPLARQYGLTPELLAFSQAWECAEGGVVVATKGAPEAIAGLCGFDAEQTAAMLADVARLAARGLRVLAVAHAGPFDAAPEDPRHRVFHWDGLVGFEDPLRASAPPAIALARSAGIRVVMITGDFPATALAIAAQAGIDTAAGALSGPEIAALDDPALDAAVARASVFARIRPEQKLRLVEAFKRRGEVVAMTGDGVNDAPALKAAHIGLAMAGGGTDVAREAAAMTLTDDNFASIVAAIEEGRAIFANIRKYLMFLLGSNIGEIGLMTGAALFGLPLPLTAVQILYVNLATDGLPALALAVDPADPDLGSRQPRDPRQGIFTRPVVTLMLAAGLWSALVNLALFAWLLHGGRDPAAAMTMTFVCLVLLQFFSAYGLRSDRTPIWRRPFANRWLNLAILWEIGLLALIVYLPALQGPFATAALSASDLLLVLAVAASVVPVIEIAKAANRRGK